VKTHIIRQEDYTPPNHGQAPAAISWNDTLVTSLYFVAPSLTARQVKRMLCRIRHAGEQIPFASEPPQVARQPLDE
jgi:hypothetical protein